MRLWQSVIVLVVECAHLRLGKYWCLPIIDGFASARPDTHDDDEIEGMSLKKTRGVAYSRE